MSSNNTTVNGASTADSILAATPTGITEAAAVTAATAAAAGLSPARLGALLVALGGSLDTDDDLVILLQSVVEIATEAIDGAASSGVTIALSGRVFTAVHTDERTLAVDIEQYAVEDGPCLYAVRTGEVVRVGTDESAERWPTFAAAARTQGIRSFLAAPLRAADVTFGALNLYGTEDHAFQTLDADILEVLTTTVSRAIGDFARFKTAAQTADDIRGALKHREIIEQAKGMLMAIHQINADAAFALLRTESQNSNRKIREVSAEIVNRLATPSPNSPTR